MTFEDNRIKIIVHRAIDFLEMYLENLDRTEIMSFVNLKEIASGERNLNDNDFNLWKAYSWVEYSIFQLRLKKNNLYENTSVKSIIKRNLKKNIDIITVVTLLKERLKKIDYDDYEMMIITLREVRDFLRKILKRTVFTRGKTYKPFNNLKK